VDYDPFVRGPFPVGVRSGTLTDRDRSDRPLPFELWYPAVPATFGLDVSPLTQDTFTVLPSGPLLRQAAVRDASIQPGRYPTVVFSHTSLGHRRQSTFLCTHLASHGYVVAAVDHTGNTFADLVDRARSGRVLSPEERGAHIDRIIADRVPDVRFLVSAVASGAAGGVADHVDSDRLGLLGWSFGGWAVLATPEVDDRPRAVVALAPGGSSNPLPGIIPAKLTFAWHRDVPTLYLVAERDRFTPLDGMLELFNRTPSHTVMFVLNHADHDHFGDHIEPELVPHQHAHLFTRGLTLAHFDATLRGNESAQRFLADAAAALRARGVNATAH